MKSYDTIVIGAGIMGTLIAYELSKAGQKVLVLEKKDTGMGTGGATGGIVSWFTKQPGYHRELFMESWRLFDELEEEIGDIGLDRHKGFMQLIENDMELELVKKGLENMQVPAGYSLSLLNRREMLELEPNVGPEIIGALFTPDSGHVHSFKYIYAALEAAKRMGAEIRNETGVSSLLRTDSRIMGVETDKGERIYGDTVVNCAGVWGARIAKMAGIEMPIRPRRGQIVALEACDPFVHRPITNSMYQVIKFHPELVTDELVKRLGYTFAIEQSEEGTIMLNNTREFAGFDTGVTQEAIQCIVQGAVKHFPGLKGMSIIRAFAGLRPYTPDGLPIIGRIDGLDGFLMAAGHEGDGIALSPITAAIVRDLLICGQAKVDIAKLSPMRFLGEEAGKI